MVAMFNPGHFGSKSKLLVPVSKCQWSSLVGLIFLNFIWLRFMANREATHAGWKQLASGNWQSSDGKEYMKVWTDTSTPAHPNTGKWEYIPVPEAGQPPLVFAQPGGATRVVGRVPPPPPPPAAAWQEQGHDSWGGSQGGREAGPPTALALPAKKGQWGRTLASDTEWKKYQDFKDEQAAKAAEGPGDAFSIRLQQRHGLFGKDFHTTGSGPVQELWTEKDLSSVLILDRRRPINQEDVGVLNTPFQTVHPEIAKKNHNSHTSRKDSRLAIEGHDGTLFSAFFVKTFANVKIVLATSMKLEKSVQYCPKTGALDRFMAGCDGTKDFMMTQISTEERQRTMMKFSVFCLQPGVDWAGEEHSKAQGIQSFLLFSVEMIAWTSNTNMETGNSVWVEESIETLLGQDMSLGHNPRHLKFNLTVWTGGHVGSFTWTTCGTGMVALTHDEDFMPTVVQLGQPQVMVDMRVTDPSGPAAAGRDPTITEVAFRDLRNQVTCVCNEEKGPVEVLRISCIKGPSLNHILSAATAQGARVDGPPAEMSYETQHSLHKDWMELAQDIKEYDKTNDRFSMSEVKKFFFYGNRWAKIRELRQDEGRQHMIVQPEWDLGKVFEVPLETLALGLSYGQRKDLGSPNMRRLPTFESGIAVTVPEIDMETHEVVGAPASSSA